MLMSYEADMAKRYRANAEELRTIAECDDVVQTKDTLLNIASDYDRMASAFEAIEATNKRIDARKDRQVN